MRSSSAVINKALRKHLSPVIRDAAFGKVDARNAWAWREDCIWVLNVRAVGSYFADVTGWPPASVGVWLGVYYTFIPPTRPPKIDAKGRILPAEYQCHMRSHLDRRLPQDDRVRALSNRAERARTDLWWLDPDGTNADEVALDIASVFSESGLPWLERGADLDAAFIDVEAERNCFSKFVLARYLADRLGRIEARAKYETLAEKEGQRIGKQPAGADWFTMAGR